MKIIVGIGNPGKEYAGTRHNIGFMVLDRLAETMGAGRWRTRFQSLTVEGMAAGTRCVLLKPQTYVNESGRAVQAAAQWCRTEPHDVMVVVDDFNLALGRLRVRGGGGSGGHNGVASIVEHLGTDEVPRLRIGIGGVDGRRARNYVLGRFEADERDAVDASIARAVRAVEVWLASGLEPCQNEFNADPNAGSRSDDKDENEEADA